MSLDEPVTTEEGAEAEPETSEQEAFRTFPIVRFIPVKSDVFEGKDRPGIQLIARSSGKFLLIPYNIVTLNREEAGDLWSALGNLLEETKQEDPEPEPEVITDDPGPRGEEKIVAPKQSGKRKKKDKAAESTP